MKKSCTALLLLMASAVAWSQPSPRVALVLSGGGALGYAHIGAFQALDEVGLKPAVIAGTSIGAIVGVVYAQGYSGNQLYELMKSRRLNSLSRNVHASLRHARRGVGSYKRVRQLFDDVLPHDCFDSLSIPFLCVATNIRTGKAEVRSSGTSLSSWVLASASIPVVFKPQLIDGEYYCDGGFVDNFPAQYLPAGTYDVVIGIDLSPTQAPSVEDYYTGRYQINDVYSNMILNINSIVGRDRCDYVVCPHADVNYGILDFRHYDELCRRGYLAMKSFLSQHPELLPR